MICKVCNKKFKYHSFDAISDCLQKKGIPISNYLLDVSDSGIFKYDKESIIEVLRK